MEELLTRTETAERLGCSTDSVKHMTRQGLLRAVYLTGHRVREAPLYRATEVSALMELKHRNLGIGDVGRLAKIATVQTESLARRFDQLTELLGLDIPVLDITEPAVLQLYVEIEQLLELEQLPQDVQFVMVWARRFYAMGEEQFELFGQHTGDPEPWSKPMKLATRMFLKRPTTQDLELETAYRHLMVGRRFMRQAAYFYIRTQHGTRAANRVFHEVDGDLDRRLLAVAFS